MEKIDILDVDTNRLNFLAKELRDGKIFIFPTSTVYGICANAFNKTAVKNIYDIKKRSTKKPLIVLACDTDMVLEITDGSNLTQKKLADIFWPGGLTIILNKKNCIDDIVTGGNRSIAIRVDESDFLRNIIAKAQVPIVAPSANFSTKPCQVDCKNIDYNLQNKVDYVIDAGCIKDGEESTIVKVIDDKIQILREGKIKKSDFVNHGFKILQ